MLVVMFNKETEGETSQGLKVKFPQGTRAELIDGPVVDNRGSYVVVGHPLGEVSVYGPDLSILIEEERSPVVSRLADLCGVLALVIAAGVVVYMVVTG